MLPRGCRIVEEDTGAKYKFAFRAVCPRLKPSAGTPRGFIGRIEAYKTKVRGHVVYTVAGINVDERHHRKKIGTALYEAAAKEACRRRSHLASTSRNPLSRSNDFWLKQVGKGRAERFRHNDAGAEDSMSYDALVLTDCSDTDLSGLRNTNTRTGKRGKNGQALHRSAGVPPRWCR